MKLAMAMSTAIGGPKLQIRQEKDEAILERQRVQSRALLRRCIAGGVRFTFVLLFATTLAVIIVVHHTEIDSLAAQNSQRVAARVKQQADASPFRQSALAHEKQIDEITQASSVE